MIPVNDLSRQNPEELARTTELLSEVLASGSFILGEKVSRFEQALAEFIGKKHAVGVASGTDALVLALRALGVSDSMQVATQPNAGGYSTIAIRLNGGTPVYVDSNENGSIDPIALENIFSEQPNIQFVIVTHLYGLVGDIAAIKEICERYGVRLIEDCAQSIGASLEQGMAGSFGEVSTFSFYPTKNLGAIGDAGAILTDDDELALKLKQLRQYGWTARYCVETDSGINSRMDELQATVLLERLPKLLENNRIRRGIWLRYLQALENTPWTMIGENSERFAAHLAILVAPIGLRDEAREYLHNAGVGTAVHYPILDYEQKAWTQPSASVCIKAEHLSQNILTLPLFPAMNEAELERVCKALETMVRVVV